MQEEKDEVLDLHNFHEGPLVQQKGGNYPGKNFSINFQTTNMMENMINRDTFEKKMTQLDRGGYLKLFNTQHSLSN